MIDGTIEGDRSTNGVVVNREKIEKTELKHGDNIYFTGDVMLDSYLNWKKNNKRKFEKKHIFFTLHRPYNTDNKVRLKKILKIINLISKKNQTILSLHPRTKKI